MAFGIRTAALLVTNSVAEMVVCSILGIVRTVTADCLVFIARGNVMPSVQEVVIGRQAIATVAQSGIGVNIAKTDVP